MLRSRFVTPLLLLLLLGPFVSAQIKPVVGTPLDLFYRPDAAGPLAEADSLELVYVFNFWGTRTGTRLALFENVLRPDPTRVKKILMVKTDIGWKATIDIPSYAAVLSYYVTDGVHRDDNKERTYAWRVYDKDGQPVRNARYFMTHFLELGRESIDARVKESEDEIVAYPENFKAYIQYFPLLFEQEKGSERVRNRILEKLSALESAYPENTDVLNLIAHTLYYVLRETEKGLEYKNRIGISNQWPEVVLMFDRERTFEQQRRVAQERKNKREALLHTNILGFSFLDFGLQKQALRADSGSVIVLTFWATSSEQSKKMFKPLMKLQEKYRGKPLKILLVNVDPDHNVAAKFLEQEPLPIEQRINFGSNLIELGVDSIPMTFVLDKSGSVRKILVGYAEERESELDQLLETLL